MTRKQHRFPLLLLSLPFSLPLSFETSDVSMQESRMQRNNDHYGEMYDVFQHIHFPPPVPLPWDLNWSSVLSATQG